LFVQSHSAQETSFPKSPGRLRLGFNERLDHSLGELWPLLSLGENNLPIAYLTASRFDGERPHPLQNDGRASLVAIGEHYSRLRDLRHEDESFQELPTGLRKGLDREDPFLSIDFHLTVAEIGNFYGDRPATGALRDLIDDLLREAIEHDPTQFRPPNSGPELPAAPGKHMECKADR